MKVQWRKFKYDTQAWWHHPKRTPFDWLKRGKYYWGPGAEQLDVWKRRGGWGF